MHFGILELLLGALSSPLSNRSQRWALHANHVARWIWIIAGLFGMLCLQELHFRNRRNAIPKSITSVIRLGSASSSWDSNKKHGRFRFNYHSCVFNQIKVASVFSKLLYFLHKLLDSRFAQLAIPQAVVFEVGTDNDCVRLAEIILKIVPGDAGTH